MHIESFYTEILKKDYKTERTAMNDALYEVYMQGLARGVDAVFDSNLLWGTINIIEEYSRENPNIYKMKNFKNE